MPAAVTSEQVKSIIETDLIDLTPFIDMAVLTVTEELSDKGLSVAKLDMIVLWLSAHNVTLSDRQVKSVEFGDAENEYQTNTGKGFESSTYGQQVLNLDTSGTLASLGRGTAELWSL